MFEEKDEKRTSCEGCRTGNYFLCDSFPGKPKEHAQREVDYRKRKARLKGRAARGGPQVYRREEDEVE